MNCPVDNTTLQMTDRNGVEIDYCPKCRGVWLDRGELDKVIERAGMNMPSSAPKEERPRPEYRKDSDYHKDSRYHHRERENPIADMFDFF